MVDEEQGMEEEADKDEEIDDIDDSDLDAFLPNNEKADPKTNEDVENEEINTKKMAEVEGTANDSESNYEEIMEDTKDECGSFGALKNVVIPRSGPGLTKIFLEYLTPADAGRAIQQLAGRTFDGRKVTAVYFDEDKFNSQDYSDDK